VVPKHRAQKMASMIRGEVARLLLTEISDPRLRHLVVTDVELSSDLRYAKIFYENSPSNDQKEVTRGLVKAVAFFRRKLGSNLDLKYVPELTFEADEHSGRLNRILSVLEENKVDQPHE
jgi:ribosome-binding factor A